MYDQSTVGRPRKPLPLTKLCPRCERDLPRSAFRVKPSGRGQDPRVSRCRQCESELNAEKWRSDPERRRQVKEGNRRRQERLRALRPAPPPPPTEKHCNGCGVTKSLSEFHRSKDRIQSRCKICARAATDLWRRNNPQRFRSRRTAMNAKLRALKRGVTAERIDRLAVYDRESGRCHICHRPVSRVRFHLEHLVPLSKGGEHTYSNVAIAHPHCNQAKAARLMEVQFRLGI